MPQGWLDANSVPYNRSDPDLLKIRKDALDQRRLQLSYARDKLAPTGQISPHEPRKWTPMSYIAEGRCGDISLWIWKDSTLNEEHVERQVVLKTELTDAHGQSKFDQDPEGRIMKQILDEQRTDHLVTMVYNGPDYHKLYLEYCINGDLQENISIAIRHPPDELPGRKAFYPEVHLWRMFMCLVKGSMSLGGEHLKDEFGSPPPVIIHFDLKPANIFMGGQYDREHQHPNCRGGEGEEMLKIGDFGDAWPLKKSQFDIKDSGDPKASLQERFREASLIGGRGTPGYHPPEQRLIMEENPTFSLDWEHAEFWNGWETGYGYSSKTNIWGIGAIMWQAICLNEVSPTLQEGNTNHNKFFHTINREKSDLWPFSPHRIRQPDPLEEELSRSIPRAEELKVQTYGPEICDPDLRRLYHLHNGLLIDLILICLADRPRRRPTNQELFHVVEKVLTSFDPNDRSGTIEEASSPRSKAPSASSGGEDTSTRRETETGETNEDKWKSEGEEQEDIAPTPPPPPPETENFELHSDGSIRSWTSIPSSKLVSSSMLPPDTATGPRSPITILPENMRPYTNPPSSITPRSRIAATRRRKTASTSNFQTIFESEAKIGPPPPPPPRASSKRAGWSGDDGGDKQTEKKEEIEKEKDLEKQKEKARAEANEEEEQKGKQGWRPTQRRIRLITFLCCRMPSLEVCLGLLFFLVVFFLMGFCLIQDMLVEWDSQF